MPLPAPPIPAERPRVRPAVPGRRGLLATAGGLCAALLAGCSDDGGDDASVRRAAAASADARARARAARDSQGLLARYEAVLAAHPRLTARLGPLRDEVLRHVEAFTGTTASPSATASGTASGGPAASSRPRPSAPPPDGFTVPGDEKGARTALAAAERTLSSARLGALAAVSAETARLLASTAAAGAAHVYLLTEGDK